MAKPPEPFEPNGPEPPPAPIICQSCGMPMGRKEDFGTTAKGGRNREYCIHCFQNGKFTNPDMTMGQMIEHMVGMGAKMNMSEEQVRKIASQMLPKLKRWKK